VSPRSFEYLRWRSDPTFDILTFDISDLGCSHFQILHFDYDMRSHYVMTFSYFDIWRTVFHVWRLTFDISTFGTLSFVTMHVTSHANQYPRGVWHMTFWYFDIWRKVSDAWHLISWHLASEIWHVHIFTFDIGHFDYDMWLHYVIFSYFDIWRKVVNIWHLTLRS